MKSIIPNISVENCQGAVDFYQKVFGGEVQRLQLSDGVKGFEGQEGKILHAEVHINENCIIYLADIFQETNKGEHISLVLEMESKEEINQVYSELIKDGSVQFELQQTFWGALHAMVTDKFGISWSLNYTLEENDS